MTPLTDEQVGRRAKWLIVLTAFLLVGSIVFILYAPFIPKNLFSVVHS